ncbi:MAG: hypothetical protein M1281_19570 [Chloroflexi bacterium]|nr:hypothetical protein [Chloroflexota bacterium]
MIRQTLAKKPVIISLLILQVIPLVMFPAASFAADTQEWWLPVLLAILVVAADARLLARRGEITWPWHLIAFAQGLSIISRLMMLMPHAIETINGAQVVDTGYIILSVLSMLLSAVLIWYVELPEVRMAMIRD